MEHLSPQLRQEYDRWENRIARLAPQVAPNRSWLEAGTTHFQSWERPVPVFAVRPFVVLR